MNLSEHLLLSDVNSSEIVKQLNLTNEPTTEHLSNLQLLATQIYEPLYNHFNGEVYVSPSYINPELRSKVGGGEDGYQGFTGELLYFNQEGKNTLVNNKMIFDYIKANLKFDRLVWEFGDNTNPFRVSVSYSASGTQRKESLRCKRSKNGILYRTY
jgi:hypothetical protein